MARSLAAAWPRAQLPKVEFWSGRRFNRERVFVALRGATSALFLWLQERCLPSWFILWVRLVSNNVFRTYSIHKLLVQHDVRMEVQHLAWVLRLVWVLLVQSYVPDGLRLLVDTGMSRFFMGTMAAWIEYLQSDCPPGKEQVNWTAQSDATLGFFVSMYGIAYPSLFVSIMSKTVFWTIIAFANWASGWNVGVATFTTTLSVDTRSLVTPLVDWLPSWLHFPTRVLLLTLLFVVLKKVRFKPFENQIPHPELSRIPKFVVIKLSLLLEVFEYLEAAMFGYVPKWCQRQLCLHQKKQRLLANTSKYQYLPLKSGEIRLLVLAKAALPIAGTLTAEIKHVPLSSTLKYEAMSYRWGAPSLDEEILVEGSSLRITQSAFEVLLAHRSHLFERVIWIDAICIDQMNYEEKSQQVQVMSEIYRKASRVILFPYNNWRARLAVGLIYQHGLSRPANSGSTSAFDLRDLMLEGQPFFAPRWEAVARLLAHEYFNRSWVVQEVAVATKVELCLGGIYVPWAMFYRAVLMLQQPAKATLLYNKHFKPPIARLHFHNIYFLNSLRPDSRLSSSSVYRTHTELTQLESVLYITSDFQASDPRDKVYAIMGIVNEAQEQLPRPDYTESVERVFEHVADLLFRDRNNPSINILTFAGHGYPDEQRMKQSWIPQLLHNRSRLPFTNFLLRNPRFGASGKTRVSITEGFLPGSLLIKGRDCDSILTISLAESPKGLKILGAIGPAVSMLTGIIDFMIDAIDFTQSYITDFPSNPPAPDARLHHALIADSDLSVTHENFQGWHETIRQLVKNDIDATKETLLLQQKLGRDPGFLTYLNHLIEACTGRCFAVTTSGRFCLIPPNTHVGDVVFTPSGAQTPYIVRREQREGRNCYVLIGEAYVQGIMQGEMMRDSGELTAITIV